MINLSNIPTSPGVYIYRNKLGEIIYVGKAINLKKRVTQYFQRDDALGPKTKTLVSQIDSIETKTVGSEIEALILESSLIKKHIPKYNSLMRDDRSYIYIVVTHDKLPIVYSTHKSNLPNNADTFGPFPSGSDVKTLLKTIRRIFPYYTKVHPQKHCLYCHLGLCPGPQVSPILYRATINKIKKILNGKFSLLRRQLVKEMSTLSAIQKYESALTVRKQIESLDYVVNGWKNLSSMFADINLPDDISSRATQELITTISPYLEVNKLKRVECFDISQLGTKYFVGSMTVAIDGKLEHGQYRQFKISTKYTADDQFMIREVVYRRLQHPEWGTPDLIVVDGGKPQVSSATQIFDRVIGLAKKFETIIIKDDDKYVEINLPDNSSALNLLKNLRNEAHRFANRYRKTLMSKSTINEG